MFRLPVSGVEVCLRQPAGAEDVLLHEAYASNTALALSLLDRVASLSDGNATDWGALSVTDLEAMLLALRQRVFGDLLRTDIVCPADGCAAKMDVSFRVSDYLAHHQPRLLRVVGPADEVGWYRFGDLPVAFRLPSGADQVAIHHSPQPERDLIQRCVRPADVSARVRRRVERAMEALAPSLSHELQARCPDCRSQVALYFDAQDFVLSELRDQAAFVYEDVHLIAQHYHWSEAEIMGLPRRRRRYYAELIRLEWTAA